MLEDRCCEIVCDILCGHEAFKLRNFFTLTSYFNSVENKTKSNKQKIACVLMPPPLQKKKDKTKETKKKQSRRRIKSLSFQLFLMGGGFCKQAYRKCIKRLTAVGYGELL